MPHAEFVHLHVHSAYSLSEGALRIADLVALCRMHRMPAVAVTDTGNLFGALEFSNACRNAGIQPIVGTAVAMRREATGDGDAGGHDSEYLVLLVQNETGYGNLLKLSSRSFLETPMGEPPHLHIDALAGLTDGLIALTGGASGPVDRLLGRGQAEIAEGLLQRLETLFPGRLYIELQRYGSGPGPVEHELLALAYQHDLPIVATNEAFFAGEDMFEAHDALICVAEGAYVSQAERRRLTPEHRFKSVEEMAALFADLPEALTNTLVIARRCAYAPTEREPILPRYPTEPGRNEGEELAVLAVAGLERRLETEVFRAGMAAAAQAEAANPYRERLQHELGVITGMNYAGYFLIVADFIAWARDHDIPVGPGRGSGAGSLVAWALTITDLDPLRFGLLFERFLNPDRVSMPDFDIDFCQDRRDEVIHYVQEQFGHDRVAQIITFGTLQARAAIRDVGRVLQLPYGLVDRLSKLVPHNSANPVKLAEAIKSEPRFDDLRAREEGVDRLLDIAQKLEGLYRHASTHAAGIVIADRPLNELVPLYQDPRSDMPATQFSMKYAEQSGLVKFDFLGLKTLSVIDRTVRLLAGRGIDIDIAHIPLDDRATYEMLQRAESVGVFQFESGGMRDLLRDSEPSNIEDLIALVALFRPGPMENIPKYVACKNGREAPEFLHESLEPVVKDTYGVIIYQEQVMQIAQVFAGFTLAQADLLRRAMGKKIKSEMAAQRDTFVDGAVARGVERDRAEYVFVLVDKFAGYGFNKAHSAGYALLAYQTAWLKANHPVEFFAATMTLDLNHTEKLAVSREELKRLEITMLPPDVNRSGADFTVETDASGNAAVRYALAAVKNVGRAAMQGLVAAREAGGPFTSLTGFAERLDPHLVNKRQIENLARAGAFDSLEINRAGVLAAAETLLRHAASSAAARESGQESLFGASSDTATDTIRVTDDPWSKMDLLKEEFDAVGTYLTAHPLESYATSLERLGVVTHADAVAQASGEARRIKLAGAVLGRREHRSSRGNRFAFLRLSDSSGAYEITVFSEQLAAARELLEGGKSVLATVEARVDDNGEVRLTAQRIQSLDAAVAHAAAGLEVFLDAAGSEEDFGVLRAHLEAASKGRGHIHLHVQIAEEGRVVEIGLPGGFAISPALRAELEMAPGVVRLRDL